MKIYIDFDNFTSDLVVTSVYGKKCRITYMLSGGSWEKEEDKIANYYEGSVVALNKPVKDNYTVVISGTLGNTAFSFFAANPVDAHFSNGVSSEP